MTRIIAITILTVLGFCLFGCAKGDKRIRLRFKYEPGMKMTYRQVTKGSHMAYIGDSVITDRSNEITWILDLIVRRVLEDSTAEIVEHRDLRLKSLDNISSEQIDSSHEEAGMRMFVAPNGKIVSFEYPDSSDARNSAYLRNYYEQGMPVFPSVEVSQGYEWTQSYSVILEDEEMTASTTYGIKSFAREQGYDCVVIAYNGNLVLPISAVPQDSTQRHGVDKVSITGVMYFAYKEGLVVLQKERWLLDGQRSKLTGNKQVSYRHAIEYDVEYALTEFHGRR